MKFNDYKALLTNASDSPKEKLLAVAETGELPPEGHGLPVQRTRTVPGIPHGNRTSFALCPGVVSEDGT